MEFTEEKIEKSETESTEKMLDMLSREALSDASIMLEELMSPHRRSDVEIIILNQAGLEQPSDISVTSPDDELISHHDLIKMVNIQAETILRYIREGKLVPDHIEQNSKYYFSVRNIKKYSERYGWTFITDECLKNMFYETLSGKSMSYSYKPVLIKAMLEYADLTRGECGLNEVVRYFIAFYADRRIKGLFVEKEKSVFSRSACSEKEAMDVILKYPYKRFADRQLMYYIKERRVIGFNPILWNGFSKEEKAEIRDICDRTLRRYYSRFDTLKRE